MRGDVQDPKNFIYADKLPKRQAKGKHFKQNARLGGFGRGSWQHALKKSEEMEEIFWRRQIFGQSRSRKRKKAFGEGDYLVSGEEEEQKKIFGEGKYLVSGGNGKGRKHLFFYC